MLAAAMNSTYIHAVHIELDGGRQGGRKAAKERGRMANGREGAKGRCLGLEGNK